MLAETASGCRRPIEDRAGWQFPQELRSWKFSYDMAIFTVRSILSRPVVPTLAAGITPGSPRYRRIVPFAGPGSIGPAHWPGCPISLCWYRAATSAAFARGSARSPAQARCRWRTKKSQPQDSLPIRSTTPPPRLRRACCKNTRACAIGYDGRVCDSLSVLLSTEFSVRRAAGLANLWTMRSPTSGPMNP